jgi:hypothetical protein
MRQHSINFETAREASKMLLTVRRSISHGPMSFQYPQLQAARVDRVLSRADLHFVERKRRRAIVQ